MNTWQGHFEDTKNKPPNKILMEALSYVEEKSTALDLGSGALVESKYLLSLGLTVIAVDQEKSLEQISDRNFKFIQSSFADYEFPKETFDLITAQFSLPFNGPSGFDSLWSKIISSLKPGGVFVGQLFGEHDEWNTPETKLVFHSRKQTEDLLFGLEVLKFEEVEKDSKLANGTPKHWHFFNIIARKN